MSDGQRRLLCRSAFTLFCIFPTLVVASWVLFPKSLSQWRVGIEQSIGVKVQLSRAMTPTPFHTILEQLRLTDRHNQLLAQIAQVDWVRGKTQQILLLSDLSIGLDECTWIAQHLLNRFRYDNADCKKAILKIGKLTVRRSGCDDSITLRNCQILLEPAGGGVRMLCEFLSDSAATESIRWEMHFGQNATVIDSWSFSTGETNRLPVWLFSGLIPEINSLGDSAQFGAKYLGGYFDGSDRILQAETLQLQRIDLAAGFSKQFGFEARGELNLLVRSCHFSNQRLESINVQVSGDSGEIDSRFLESAKYWLKINCAAFSEQAVVGFKNLLFGFEIRSQQVFIWGPVPGYVIAEDQDGQPLASATRASGNLPIHLLACCLARQSEALVPADPIALNLMRYLSATPAAN